MFRFNQILNPEKEGKSINELLIEHLKDHRFVIALGRFEGTWYNDVFPIPVTSSDCKLTIGNGNLTLCFDSRFFLNACLGQNKIKQVKTCRNKMLNTLDKIEDVLGEVPVVQELRKDIDKYHTAINEMFDLNDSVSDNIDNR